MTIILLAAITTAVAQDTIFGIEFRYYKNPQDFINTYRSRAKSFKVSDIPEYGFTANSISAEDVNLNGAKLDYAAFGLMPDYGSGQLLSTMAGTSSFDDPQKAMDFFDKIQSLATLEQMTIIDYHDSSEVVQEEEEEADKNNDYNLLGVVYRSQAGSNVILMLLQSKTGKESKVFIQIK